MADVSTSNALSPYDWLDNPPTTQVAAVERLLELCKADLSAVPKLSPAHVLPLIRPFLANPERDYGYIARLWASVTQLLIMQITAFGHHESSRTERRLYWLVRRFFKPPQNDVAESLDELRQTLREKATPVSFFADLFPVRRADTHPDWAAQGLQGLELEGRVEARPMGRFSVTRLVIELRVDGSDGRFVDSDPKTTHAAGVQYAMASVRGRSVRDTSVSEDTLASEIGAGSVHVRAGATESHTQDSSANESREDRIAFATKDAFVISSPIQRQARWEFFKSLEQAPVGGIAVKATYLWPKSKTEIGISVHVEAEIEGWGAVTMDPVYSALLPIPSM